MALKTTADSKLKKPLPVKLAADHQKPKVIGYLRVSTGDQELEKKQIRYSASGKSPEFRTGTFCRRAHFGKGFVEKAEDFGNYREVY